MTKKTKTKTKDQMELEKLRAAKRASSLKAKTLRKELSDLQKKARKKVKAVYQVMLKKELSKLSPIQGRLKSYTRQSSSLGASIKKVVTRNQEARYKALLMPKTGAIQKVYKKASSRYGHKDVIVTLSIPAKAQRFQETDRHSQHRWKCRASEAKVIALEDIYTKQPVNYARSIYDSSFEYHVGKIVKPKNGEHENYSFGACRAGIHFFMTKAKARSY